MVFFGVYSAILLLSLQLTVLKLIHPPILLLQFNGMTEIRGEKRPSRSANLLSLGIENVCTVQRAVFSNVL